MSSPNQRQHSRATSATLRRALAVVLSIAAFTLLAVGEICAQGNPQPKKLPSPEKIVENYLKALGGKRRVSAIRDASFEWTIELNDQPIGQARTQIKSPASRRFEMKFGNGEIIAGASPASAWVKGLDNRVVTLTGAEAATAKLQALLDAGHLLDYKKSNVMAGATRCRPFA
ncbi:MAG TPA: hypothetical protein VJS64_09260 [Pyrinomonadaceae bacterium]|nr:hypothetical protein [Pyrinomonadaceae bacterium]